MRNIKTFTFGGSFDGALDGLVTVPIFLNFQPKYVTIKEISWVSTSVDIQDTPPLSVLKWSLFPDILAHIPRSANGVVQCNHKFLMPGSQLNGTITFQLLSADSPTSFSLLNSDASVVVGVSIEFMD